MTPTPETHGKYLPCLNPHCKSHGKPHPNCRCYGPGAAEPMSVGGEVGHYCSQEREHNHDCEYYASGGGVAPDFIPDEVPDFIPDSHEGGAPDFIPDEEKGHNWLETAKAGAEGVAQGLAGPLASMAETGLGISTKENIAKRQQEHPIAHGVGEAAGIIGGLASGVGEAGLISKGAGAISEAANIGKLGSAAIKAAVEASSFATSDEMTKAFLGIPGSDPEHPVSAALLNVGAAGLMGSLTGGAFSLGEALIGKGIASEAGAKAASKAQDFLFKLGKSEHPLAMLGASSILSAAPAYKTSKYIEDKTDIPVWMSLPVIETIYTAMGNRAISKMNPYITSAAVKALMENESSGIPNVFHYVTRATNGQSSAINAVKTIMSAGAGKLAPPALDSAKKNLKEFIEGGQVDKQLQDSMGGQQQRFAKGGMVSEPNNSFAKVFPEQNTALNSAKGRISGYLNSIRPLKNQPKAAFDDELPNKEKDRQYNKAIEFAVSPMTVLNHVNKGDLTPEHMKHFTSLYPEVHRFLSKEMTKQITEAQLKNEKPPYKKRQAMSLFLGADLDSSFSLLAIQSIQNLYANKKAAQQQQAPTQNKKGTSTLGKASTSYLTDEQAREKRMQTAKS